MNRSYKPTNSFWTVDKIEDEPTLKRAQSIVCGYVERLELKNGDCLLYNEEGKLTNRNQLPINTDGTKILRQSYPLAEDYIVGNVIYIKRVARKNF
jgi:hypothetical protein